MPKNQRTALLRFLLSVIAVAVGTAILGSMAAGGSTPEGRMRGRPGVSGEQVPETTAAPAGQP